MLGVRIETIARNGGNQSWEKKYANFVGAAHADQYVNGYTRNNGTYVQPYERTAPNNSTFDNYSTRGNVNPYTGQAGTVDPYRQPSYNSGNSYGGYGVNNLNRR